jgi:hypothetical protein
MPQHRAHHSAHLGDHILDIFLLLRKLLPFQGIFEGGVAVVSDLLLEESASGRAQEGFVNEKQIDMEPCSMNHHSSMICRVNFQLLNVIHNLVSALKVSHSNFIASSFSVS